MFGNGPFYRRPTTFSRTDKRPYADAFGPVDRSWPDNKRPRRYACGDSPEPSPVVLLDMKNVKYNITVDHIHRVTIPFGELRGIDIIDGPRDSMETKVFVEFCDVDAARRAVTGLSNRELFTDSCLIFAEFSSLENVRQAVAASRDQGFENGENRRFRHVSDDGFHSPSREPSSGWPSDGSKLFTRLPRGDRHVTPVAASSYSVSAREKLQERRGPRAVFGFREVNRKDKQRALTKRDCHVDRNVPKRMLSERLLSLLRPATTGDTGCFLKIAGLPPNMNPDLMVNLLGPFGCVTKVKFLRTMQGTAIVKMGDAESAERVENKLNKISCFESKLDFTVIGDRANRVLSTRRTFILPDGSESMKDFTTSFKNRISLQREYPFPSAALRIHRGPRNLAAADVQELFRKFGLFPERILLTRNQGTSGRWTCRVYFATMEEAIKGLMLANNAPMEGRIEQRPVAIAMTFCTDDPDHIKSIRRVIDDVLFTIY